MELDNKAVKNYREKEVLRSRERERWRSVCLRRRMEGEQSRGGRDSSETDENNEDFSVRKDLQNRTSVIKI